MADAQLPLGWTVQRIHDISGDREAVALHPNRAVQWVVSAGAPGAVEAPTPLHRGSEKQPHQETQASQAGVPLGGGG